MLFFNIPTKRGPMHRIKFLAKYFLGSVLFFCAFSTLSGLAAGSVTLSWDPNSESDLDHYNVYKGTTSGQYGLPRIVRKAPIGGRVIITIVFVQEGKINYFAVSAVDTSGNESVVSNEVSISIPSSDDTGNGGGDNTGGGGGNSGSGTVNLIVKVSGSGSINSTPPGINCVQGTCSGSFSKNSRVTLTPTPSGNGSFKRWGGGGCRTAKTGPCTVKMNKQTTVFARFSQ